MCRIWFSPKWILMCAMVCAIPAQRWLKGYFFSMLHIWLKGEFPNTSILEPGEAPVINLSAARKPISCQLNEVISFILKCQVHNSRALSRILGIMNCLLIILVLLLQIVLFFFSILKFANTSGSRVCAGLHDSTTICRSFKVGGEHFSSGDVYKLWAGKTKMAFLNCISDIKIALRSGNCL